METYFSTYISGVSELIPTSLTKSLKSSEIELNLDGLVCYKTASNFDQIKSLRFFNNTFILIKSFDNLVKDPFKPMQLWSLRHEYPHSIAEYINQKHIKSFRIISSNANTIIAPDRDFRTKLENKISKEYKLRIDRLSPDVEFWFLVRSEGYGFFGFRITNNSKVEQRAKGQLRPELASIMCLLSEPQVNDVFLDPFAGYGTTVIERSYYPYKKLIAIEKLTDLSATIPTKKVNVISGDFFKQKIDTKSISKIVTDPPWGIYEDNINIPEFYSNMFKRFREILIDSGKVVLLLNRETSEKLDYKYHGFNLVSTNHILVSGKKATIVVLNKSSN